MSNRRRAVPRPATARATPPLVPSSVVIAFIHPGQTSAYFTTSMMAMLLHDQNHDRRIVGLLNEWSSANVSAARNSLTAKFVDGYPDADWLLWVDADMSWEHDALDRLLALADAERAPVVSGLCFGSALGELFPTIYQMGEKDGRPVTVRVGDYPPDSMVQCAATGAAFLLTHRSVLEAIKARAFNVAFPWFQETELAGQPAGEDLTFCLRAGICGFPVHVNTGVQVGHHKSHLLTHDLFQEQRATSLAVK